MSMTFVVSSSGTLLFDFWDVDGSTGMVLSVLVVLLLTLFYELLKVWRVWLSRRITLAPTPFLLGPTPPPCCSTSHVALDNSTSSEASLTPIEGTPPTVTPRDSWHLHGAQTLLHMLQVSLGYLLMLCVMSYNLWIFLAVVGGSVLGYFLFFPLLGHS